MATILEFRVTEAKPDLKGEPVEGSFGEIIIFPGVRIERHDAAGDVHKGKASPIGPAAGARTKSRA